MRLARDLLLRLGAVVALTMACGATLAPSRASGAELEVLTSAQNATIAPDLMVLRVTGEFTTGSAEGLRRAWSSRGPAIARLLIELDSIGGALGETEAFVAVIEEIRRSARVDTLVRQGATCASACVAVFAQGERRSAGGASAWLFHGASLNGASVPSWRPTCRALDILRRAGVREGFLEMLLREGYFSRPGEFWASGYELFHVYRAGLITRLLPPWHADALAEPRSGISAR